MGCPCRKLTSILSIILFVFGVISIIMAITVTTGSTWIKDLMPEGAEPVDADGEPTASAAFADKASSFGNAFEILIYVFGIYMLVMGFLGACCCGKDKDDEPRCKWYCVLLYQIFQAGLIIVTLVIAIMPFAFWMIPAEDMTWWCLNDAESLGLHYALVGDDSWYVEHIINGRTYVADADDTISQRDNIMCTAQCPCDIENFEDWGPAFDTSNLRTEIDTGVDDWSDCEDRLELEEAGIFASYFDGFLQTMEEEFDCQGICTAGNFWLFKDVDDGPVGDACLTALKSDFSSSAMGATIVLFITVLIDLMIFLCMFRQCVKP